MVQRAQPVESAGFVLPLSMCGAVVLLLSSLSLQTLVLHNRQALALERSRQQAEDQLASGAQRLAADFQGRLACLKTVPLADWPLQVLHQPCPAGLDPDALKRLWVEGEQLQIAGWTPQREGGGLLELQLVGGALVRRYWLALSGVRELG